MDKENQFPTRKPTRLKNFDYNTIGAYFITICTQDRRQILSRIPVGVDVPGDPYDVPGDPYDVPGDPYDVPGDPYDVPGDPYDVPGDPQNVELLPCGIIADKCIKQMDEFYDHISVERYVIMPNHIHILLFVRDCGVSKTSIPASKQTSTVSHFVSTFKRFCNKEFGKNVWQRGFHDHIVRGGEDCDNIVRYICENPMRWFYDELYSEDREP